MSETEVTLDRLFRPTKPVQVSGVNLKVRALSGPEQTERSFYATSQARKLKKKMDDTESGEYQFRLAFLEEMDQDGLSFYLSRRFENDAQREVEKENPAVYQPFPEEATEEETRAVMEAREKSEADRQEKIKSEVAAKLDVYTKKFLLDENGEKKSQELLLGLAKNTISVAALSEQANMSYAYYGLFAGVQDEDGKRYFVSPEDASSLGREVVFYLHRSLEEVNDINPLDINSNGSSSTDTPTTSG